VAVRPSFPPLATSPYVPHYFLSAVQSRAHQAHPPQSTFHGNQHNDTPTASASSATATLTTITTIVGRWKHKCNSAPAMAATPTQGRPHANGTRQVAKWPNSILTIDFTNIPEPLAPSSHFSQSASPTATAPTTPDSYPKNARRVFEP
jgi:hypothetical protein